MARASQQQLARAVHASGRRLVLTLTGGASGAISALLTEPGASRSVLAAMVPYAPQALIGWLGGKPDEFCSEATARAMAMRAWLAARSCDPTAEVRGVAATASLASDRPKRGPHRIHGAWQSAGTTAAWSLELSKGARTRAEEEALTAALVLNSVAEACGIDDRLEVSLLDGEYVQTRSVQAPQDQQALLAGRVRAIPLGAASTDASPRAVFPGAFHPLHAAHHQMATVAGRLLDCEVAFEMSIDNVDKPPLDFLEIDCRARQFTGHDAVWLTRAPTFVTKSELFPGATFVVGADTIERIGQQRYYGDAAALARALAEIAASGCRFLVFGRATEGSFRTLDDLQLPAALSRLCQGVPESLFRQDLSSTELRRREEAQAVPRSQTGGQP